MTILHVLKYPPEEIYRAWLYSTGLWNSFLPLPIALLVSREIKKVTNGERTVDVLLRVLTEYQGPIE